MRKHVRKSLFIALIGIFLLVLAGCDGSKEEKKESAEPVKKETTETAQKRPVHVKLANGGATCEAPLFVAIEKGFFKEEGIEAETLFMDFETLKEGVATDKMDGVMGNLEWIKPIEQGLNVKYTTGVHTGCIQAVVPTNSKIKTIKDLKGKRIGVNAMGDFPMVLMSTALSDTGLDPKKDVEFRVYPGPQLEQALDKKEIDAFIMWDPFPQIAIDKHKAVHFFSNTKTVPYNDLNCCLLVLRGKLVDENPATAAAITRAITKGAGWVQQNPDEAAKIIVEKKYVSGEIKATADLLKQYNFKPSVTGGKESLTKIVNSFKAQGLLEASTDANALVENSYKPVTE